MPLPGCLVGRVSVSCFSATCQCFCSQIFRFSSFIKWYQRNKCTCNLKVPAYWKFYYFKQQTIYHSQQTDNKELTRNWGLNATATVRTVLEAFCFWLSTSLSSSVSCTRYMDLLLLIQLRDALAEKEDLEMQNSLLQKRLDKAKTSTHTHRGSFSKWWSPVECRYFSYEQLHAAAAMPVQTLQRNA